MQKSSSRKMRLASLCLGASVLALSPAMASSFSVGGGTVATTDTDAAADLTGTGGPFLLKPNTNTTGDVITITGVTIINTDASVTGRAFDAGGINPTSGSYSVTAHGDTLSGSTAAGLWLQSAGGTISFDSTGGAANHISGRQGVAVINTAAGGNVSIRTGADIITTTGAFAGEVLYGTTTGNGTISIDSAGATLTGGGTYGISAVTGGSGAITIGGLNGGIASSISVANGYGIFASSGSSVINATLASSGSVTALNGLYLQGGAVTVDSFGTIAATNNAIDASNSSSLLLTLEQGSATSGRIIGSSLDDSFKLITGANIAGATFNGGGGTDLMILTGSGTGTLDVSTAINFAAIEKDGSGTWTLTRSGGVGIGSVPVALNAGNLVIGTNALSGNVASAAGTSIQFNQTASGTYTGVISGGASVTKAGSGLLTVSGANTYSGGTTVSAGTLQLGASSALPAGGALAVNGGTFDLNGFSQSVGALSGSGGAIAFGGGQLTATSSADATLASAMSGPGTFVKAGAGTLTLTGSGSFSGATNVTAGRLNVMGSIAASSISVAGGSTLSGTGHVGAVTVASGGVLAPGNSTPGTLSVTGNLTLSPNATYVVNFNPVAASSTSVSGSAALAGNLVANGATGAYGAGQRYTLLTATGGISGSFASLSTPGLSGALKAALSYDTNDVFLTISPKALSPFLPPGATRNQHAVAAGIDAALQAGAVLPGGFGALFGLSGDTLGSALNQLTGEISGDAARAAAQSFTPFLDLLTRVDGRPGTDGIALAIGVPDGVRPAQLSVGEMRLWGATYGGHASYGADAASGAERLSTGTVGGAAGMEMLVSDDLLFGASIAGGSDTFSLGSSQSQGISTDLMLGLYGQAKVVDRGYLSGALVYGWHNIVTRREVTISGSDTLRASFVADDFGGRLEGGYHFGLDSVTVLTPYAAFAGQNFSSPAYSEAALSGSSTFALAFAAHDNGAAHSELGARLARDFALSTDVFSVDLHAAWAHQIEEDVTSRAGFQNVAGASFVVAGAPMPADSALLGLGFTIRSEGGMTGGARLEGQFGNGFTAGYGTVSLGYAW